jgi:hypothetical protein
MNRFACFLVALALSGLAAAADNNGSNRFSEAESALFMSNHLAAMKPPATLRYAFRKSGSLEPGFEDKVAVVLAQQADGTCCTAKAEFLGGARRLSMPDVEGAQGNPVILYFLERDVREMNRLTKGQSSYFRKRIRMSIFRGATVRETTAAYAGKSVAAREISITPYVDDPLRARFEKLALKQYVFTLSDAVPGGVVAIRSRVGPPPGAGGGDSTPLLLEELTIDDAAPSAK